MDPDKLERLTIRCARGNNGGEWASHYNEEQKKFWRKFARDLICDYESFRKPNAAEDLREA